MIEWKMCPRCLKIIFDNNIIKCITCNVTMRQYNYEPLDHEMVDFMTTGTDPRLSPRADSG